FLFFFQAEDGIRDFHVTGVQTCALPISRLMKKLGIQGVWRGKNKQTTRSRDDQKRAPDLVKRNFRADRPDPCEAVLLRSVTLRIFKPILAGSTPHLLLMCSHEQLLDGKYLHG